MTRLADAIEVGLAIPQIGAEPIDVEAVGAVIRRAEEVGFDGLWTQEALLSRDPSLDGLELLGFAAGITSTVKLGIATAVLSRHHPVLLAKRLTTLDHLSSGRLLVGVSLGGGNEYFAGANLPSDRPVLRFRECLEALKAVWRSEEPSYDGELWQIENVSVSPLPRQLPHPPVWVGAGHPAALKRAARYGNGWIGAGSSTAADFARQAKLVRQFVEELGRDPGEFTFSKRVYLAVDEDPVRAERRLEARLAGIYGSFAPPTAVAAFGPPDRVLESLWQLADAGAAHLLLNPLDDEPAQLEALAELTGVGTA